MSERISLTQAFWTAVDVVDGFVLLTNPLFGSTRWLDARKWPPKLGEPMKDLTRAVAGGPQIASLAGWNPQRVRLESSPGKNAKDVALPAKKYGYRALGFVDKRLVLVPGHLGVDNKSSPLQVAKAPVAWDGETWTPLAGEMGPHAQLAGVAGGIVVYGGRICTLDGNALVAAAELPRADADWQMHAVEIDGGLAMAAGKLALWRGGKLALHAIGTGTVARVQAHDEKLLVRTAGPHGFWTFDLKTAKASRIAVDSEVGDVFATPAGMLAISETELLRL